MPPLERQGLLFGVVGLIALSFVGGGAWQRMTGRGFAKLAAVDVGSSGSRRLWLSMRGAVCLRSVDLRCLRWFLLLWCSPLRLEMRPQERSRLRTALVPALAGLGGLLLLLPVAVFGPLAWVGDVGSLFVSPLFWQGLPVSGCTGCCLALVWRRRSRLWGTPTRCFCWFAALFREDDVWRWSGFASAVSISSLVDAIEVLLIVWLLQEMQPVRFAARYLAIPLLIVLESYVLMRPIGRLEWDLGHSCWRAARGRFCFRRRVKKRRCCLFVDAFRRGDWGFYCGEWLLRCTSWLKAKTLASISS